MWLAPGLASLRSCQRRPPQWPWGLPADLVTAASVLFCPPTSRFGFSTHSWTIGLLSGHQVDAIKCLVFYRDCTILGPWPSALFPSSSSALVSIPRGWSCSLHCTDIFVNCFPVALGLLKGTGVGMWGVWGRQEDGAGLDWGIRGGETRQRVSLILPVLSSSLVPVSVRCP